MDPFIVLLLLPALDLRHRYFFREAARRTCRIMRAELNIAIGGARPDQRKRSIGVISIDGPVEDLTVAVAQLTLVGDVGSAATIEHTNLTLILYLPGGGANS
jgi:hypothetical protein